MTPIISGTAGIPINLLFNNAGFITAGLFVDVPVARHLANYECNATCTIPITHHFANLMLARAEKGLIAFTSSSAGYFQFISSFSYFSIYMYICIYMYVMCTYTHTCIHTYIYIYTYIHIHV